MESLSKSIVEDIQVKLDSIGLMYRLFSRVKEKASLDDKISKDSGYGNGKKIQDLIGIRVVLYFNDDINIVRDIISKLYEERSKDVSIDENGQDEFRPTRYNIVYSFTKKQIDSLKLSDYFSYVDTTFELQIRTIFSEGWHEVEHDLRYKNKNDWNGFENESRLLNGVLASLENSEWTMVKLFDELAYSHYKDKQWSSMLRQKLRLRFASDILSDEMISVLDADDSLAKKLFRVDRTQLLREMAGREFYYPVKLDNLVYFINLVFLKNSDVRSITPETMIIDVEE